MANHKSALKKARQDRVRRDRNRGHRSRLRTAIKRFRGHLQAGEKDEAAKLLPDTLSIIDHSTKLGVLHENAAARTKSRLTKALNRIGA
jgi:small subunit ribosomal protein S20